ncbi:MAG TPA: protein-methionine-sulfoxide reductase heme-binding subunit MsrQ [Longimicrobiaceae bacterium]|nr:protein-methionine-sulfoxide reductase heme-binding subunit MsrQ [Longimicrobiaceae bacterium]
MVWAAALSPLAWLAWEGLDGGLGAEPIEKATHRTGLSALVLLLCSLAVTPLRRLTGWSRAVRFRRLLGLFAFFYAALHFLVYLFDQEFVPAYIVEDVVEHPYVTAGFTAFLLLLPLALTSTQGMIRRLGRRWQKLHRLVYAAAALAVLHFVWLVKKDLTEPLVYAAVLGLLLAVRLPVVTGLKKPRPRLRPRPSDPAG